MPIQAHNMIEYLFEFKNLKSSFCTDNVVFFVGTWVLNNRSNKNQEEKTIEKKYLGNGRPVCLLAFSGCGG
jgi:hypothetical protein